MNRRHLPNLISLFRILLVIPLVTLMHRGHYGAVLGVFIIAALSDGLDGYLARRFDWRSELGAILDPIGDKLLLSIVYLMLGLQGAIPLWLALVVVGRDVLIIGGAIAYFVLVGAYRMAPTWLSKFNTVIQIVLPLLVLLQLIGMAVWPELIDLLVYSVFLVTLLSGLNYVWIWGARAWNEKRSS